MAGSAASASRPDGGSIAGPAISIVIPARNEEAMIGACLAALRRQSIAPRSLEVIVVVAGEDATEAVARREGEGRFGRFEIVRLADGYKNAALQAGCARARGAMLVLLDADTELAPDALTVMVRELWSHPHVAVHGAAVPRVDTWVSRYWETNRRLVKDLRFDGNLSGEFVAVPRAALEPARLPALLPTGVGTKVDHFLGSALRAHGYEVRYAPGARATTLVPFTLRGLLSTMLRSRRGAVTLLPFPEACLQAAKSAALLAALPATLWVVLRLLVPAPAAAPPLVALVLACAAPLCVHAAAVGRHITTLRRRGLGERLLTLPAFLALDLTARAFKLWAFLERLAGRRAPHTFRGDRPAPLLPADAVER
jgi:hypothetical protein